MKGASELTNEVTLPEADVMRFVRMDKEFVGKEATRRSLDGARPWVCAYLEVEGDGLSDGNGGEAVLAGGVQIGAVSSIAWGHRSGKLLAFAYINPEHALAGTSLDVVVMGQPRAATVQGAPVYDPDNLLPRS